MNVKSVEKQEHSVVELLIEVSKEEFEAAIDNVYNKQKGKIRIPGFRKGKASRKIVEGIYGASVFYDDAVSDLYPTAYSQAVEQEKLDVVSYPSVDIINVDRDGFSFKAKVTVRPIATIKDYIGLTASKEEANVSDDDIAEELKPYINRATRIVTAERPAQSGDIAVIDYEGFDNGVPFEGGKDEKHELELGSNSFIPGFEDQVVGMSAGEEKEIKVSFPEEYHAKELAGKPVVFKVKLNQVKERIIPVLDDEFAKDVSEFETLDELKKDLADKLMERRKKESEQAFEESLINQLTELMEVEIPTPMVEYHLDKMVDDYAMRINSQGISFEQYLQMVGLTKEGMREQARPSALWQIKSRLALEAVAAAEGIQVTEEEIDEELAKMAEQYSIEFERVKKLVPQDEVRGDMLRQKAMKVVSENAKVDNTKKTAEATETEKPSKKDAAKTEKKAKDTTAAANAEKPKRKSSAKKNEESVTEE